MRLNVTFEDSKVFTRSFSSVQTWRWSIVSEVFRRWVTRGRAIVPLRSWPLTSLVLVTMTYMVSGARTPH